jgi:hypothetical protein
MIHNLLIVGHALAGAVSFVAGVLSLSLTTTRSWRFQTYLVTLVAMAALMVAAVAWDWPELDSTTRVVYLGLVGLALFMLLRALNASARLRNRDRNWRSRYIDGIGFTLISLFDGFVIVAAIDFGAPSWLVLLIAVAGVVGGVWAKNRAKHRIASRTADHAPHPWDVHGR